MTASTRTYKVGDVLTLKVPVIQGENGPCIDLGPVKDGQTNRVRVPGHQHIDRSGGLDPKFIVGCESPLRVGDKVYPKSEYRSDGVSFEGGTIMSVHPDGRFMVHWPRISENWIPWLANNLDRVD